jgi:hypothetical protein
MLAAIGEGNPVKDAATLVLLLSFSHYAHSALVFEETTKHLAPREQPPLTMRASFEDGKLRVQFAEDKGYPLILRDGALYMLNPTDQTYNVLDKAAMAQLAANDRAARKRSEENMEKLTAGQRAMMQPVIDVQAQKLAEEGQRLDLRRTDRQEIVSGNSCVVWEYYLENVKRADVCVAPSSVFAEGEEMLKAMSLVGDFLATARQALGGAAVLLYQLPSYQLRMQAAVAQQLSAVVLLWREFGRNNGPMEETALTAVRDEPLDLTIFAVPGQYKQQSLLPASTIQ